MTDKEPKIKWHSVDEIPTRPGYYVVVKYTDYLGWQTELYQLLADDGVTPAHFVDNEYAEVYLEDWKYWTEIVPPVEAYP